MKIGIVNPYLDSLAGGERYTLSLAAHWSKRHEVDVFWDDASVLTQAQERLHLDLSHVHLVPNIFQSTNIITKFIKTRTYDLLFFLSDGSVPTTFAKHNILHFQVPFTHISFPGWKQNLYDEVIVNSSFTKSHLDPVAAKKAQVIYPPVDTHVAWTKKKEKIILSVGRFTSHFQAKKQEVLIDTFKKMERELEGWKLACIGGLLPGDEPYFKRLAKKAKDSQILLFPNSPYRVLQDYYRKASIYWHAAGFGEQEPALQEHFGISTVEAMARGCIPIVYNGGGQREIIRNGKDGYLWNDVTELMNYTYQVIERGLQQEQLRSAIVQKSKDFDISVFYRQFDALINRIHS